MKRLFRVFYESHGIRLDALFYALSESAACELARDSMTPILGQVKILSVRSLCASCNANAFN